MSELNKVEFLTQGLKAKLKGQAAKYLSDLSDMMASKGCDDLQNNKFSASDLTLLSLEFHRRNGDLMEILEDGINSAYLQESMLIQLVAWVLEDEQKR